MPPSKNLKTFPIKSLPLSRRLASLTVYASLYMNQDLQSALDQGLRRASLSSKDKGLATELAYGYLRNRTRVDFIVVSFLKSPKKLPRSLLLILGLAGYELVFLDRIPSYATVNWAVEWIKKNLSIRLAGLGNAVLRRIAGLGDQTSRKDFFCLDHPDRPTFLSRYYSCPKWIVDLWLKMYGEETALTFLQASVLKPALGLRIDSDQPPDTVAANFQDILLARMGHALAVKRSPDNLEELLAQGVLTRQSFAAQKALAGLEPGTWPTPIWDACCGRGGKSMALFDQGIGPVWASDVHQGRLRGFIRECARSGKNIPLFRASAKQPPPLRNVPRTILLDVPCSGLGVLARRPDSKWKRSPRDVAVLIKTQQSILDSAWATIPQDGLVAYLTCTLNPAENQNQIARLCRMHTNAMLVKEYQTRSDEEFGEFFYGAVIKKKSGKL